MARILFIQPHKTVLTSDLDKGKDNEFLSERADRFARVVPSLPAMTVLGALKNHQAFFIDATADNPSNIFQYNKNVSLIGMSNEELYDKVNDTGADIVMLTSMFTGCVIILKK